MKRPEFKEVAYDLSRSGWVHPTCYFEETKPIASPMRREMIDVIRSSWPTGKSCAVCGGKTARPRKL